MCLSRRDLLGAGATGLLTTVAPGVKVSFAAEDPNANILVVLFLRGGSDGMQMVAPAGDANYISNRPTIRVQTTGNNAGLGLGTINGTDFYLNSQAPELKALYDAKSLAVVHATGLPTVDRSHFLCMDKMERGIADGESNINSGWLMRHLTALQNPSPAPLATVANSSNNPASLLGYPQAVAITNAEQFNISGGTANANTIRALNQGTSSYQNVARATLDTVTSVQAGLQALGTDDTTSFGYTNGTLSPALRSLGKLIKMKVGVTTATVDMGGWDHHDNLVNEFTTRTQELSRSLSAFWKDMAAFQSRLTVVTMTEFGRRFRENASQGLDHGSASMMFVLGGAVNGGRLHGDWPGLATNQLDNGDLRVVNDYRRVLQEIIVKRQGQANPATVFPAVAYNPIGIING